MQPVNNTTTGPEVKQWTDLPPHQQLTIVVTYAGMLKTVQTVSLRKCFDQGKPDVIITVKEGKNHFRIADSSVPVLTALIDAYLK